MKIRVLFVCHGNICRSPMAEFVFKDLVTKNKLEHKFVIESMATSTEALGMRVHRGTREQLIKHNIVGFENKRATQMTYADYDKFDYILLMDSRNLTNIKYIVREDRDNKIYKLLDFTSQEGDIADPWYTDDFDLTYRQISSGCLAFLEYLKNRNLI